MAKEKIYLLFSHWDQDTEYEINCVTTDFDTFQRSIEDYDFEDCSELAELKGNKRSVYLDRVMYTHYYAYTFEVEIPEDRILYALCVNGYERYNWCGEIQGIYQSVEDVRHAIIDECFEYDDEDEAESSEVNEEMKTFDEHGFYTDDDYSYWEYVKFNV